MSAGSRDDGCDVTVISEPTQAELKSRGAAVSAVAEVCYPFCRKHGRYCAANRRSFIALLAGAAAACTGRRSDRMISALIGESYE